MTLEEMEKSAAPAAQSAEPGFKSSYDGEIKKHYDKLANREAFKYDHLSDPSYQAYRDSYTRQGKLAMKDSMGQAAALTGGYGSSYGENVAQQSYAGYLEKLSNLMPELYKDAYERYLNEGSLLSERLSAATGLAGMELERYSAGLDKEKLDYQKQQDAYKNLASVISATGYAPSDEELEKGGMSRAEAQALSYEFMRVNGLLPLEGAAGAGEINYYDLHPTSPFDIGYREGMFDRGSANSQSGTRRQTDNSYSLQKW